MSSELLTSELFERVLVDPVVRKHADRLRILSGYATPAMAFHHMQALKPLGARVPVELVVGMTGRGAITRTVHAGFAALQSADAASFRCLYLPPRSCSHVKLYVWYRKTRPLIAFTGSANYSQTAFNLRLQQEALTECSPTDAHRLLDEAVALGISCLAPEATGFAEEERPRPVPEVAVGAETQSVRLPLLTASGRVGVRSGLNWGQREGREPNQAYIPVPANVCRSDFLPPVGVHFTVRTDDGKVFTCVRAQANGKAVETPHDNSLLGRWFRARMGLESGAHVRHSDLERYGRTDVTLTKVGEEAYYLDFSV